ncbi:MAG: aldehyde dehydrogenase family protein, partial [Aggregatilineales bacterium]
MATERKHIKVTYSSLASPDPLLHEYYDEDVAKVRDMLGQDIASIYINGEWRKSKKSFSGKSPIDHDMNIGTFYEADTATVDEAIAVAKATFNSWRNTPWQERVALIARVAELVSERLFEISAVLSLEIGKNRLEAIGEVEEAADILRYAVEAMNEYGGFQRGLASESDKYHNTSVLKPYGVWGI